MNRNIGFSRLVPEQKMATLKATMVHPNDENKYRQYYAYLALQNQLNGSELELNETGLQYLAQATQRGAGNDMHDAMLAGGTAGDIFLTLMLMRRDNVPHAGIDKACYYVSNFLNNTESGGGKRIKLLPNTAKQHWNNYRDVAHFWAVWRQQTTAKSIVDDIFNGSSNTFRYIKYYEDMGLNTRLESDSGRTALLSDTVWRIADYEPLAPIKPIPAVPWDVAFKDYKTRKR